MFDWDYDKNYFYTKLDPDLILEDIKPLKEPYSGITVSAIKENDNKKIIIQCLKTSQREDIINDFIQQIKSLNTEYICKLYIKYNPACEYFLTITPYCEKTLSNVNPMNHFTGIKTRNKLILSIFDVLRCFVSHDLVHGDLKPSNILITDDGKCIVTDYYKYKFMSESLISDDDITSYSYYSPEMIQNKPITIKSDIWSLGCIIYYCCSGKSPFYSNSINRIRRKINNLKFKPLTGEFEVYNNILSKMLVIDLKSRCNISELSEYFEKIDNLPIPLQEAEGEVIFLPSSNEGQNDNEKPKYCIYNVDSEDVDILTNVDFDKIWIEIVYCQWCNDKERMIKYLDYVKSVKEKGFALREFMCRLINNIEYLPLLWNYIDKYINDDSFKYINDTTFMSDYRFCVTPQFRFPSKYHNLTFLYGCGKIIGNNSLVVKNKYDMKNSCYNYNFKVSQLSEHNFRIAATKRKLYGEVEETNDKPSVDKKRITFSEEIKDIDTQISNPVKLFFIFFSKYATPERMKDLTIPLHYLPQYVISSKYINIYPSECGLYTSISISPNLPDGLKLNKTTGRIHGIHKIEKHFVGQFTVTAFINDKEVNKSNFSLTIVKEKNLTLIEKKCNIHSFLYLKYKHKHYSFKVGEEIKEIRPSFSCENPKFSIISETPPGLKINEKTGSLSGKLSEYFNEYSLIIKMTNGYESTAKEILINCKTNGEKNIKEWIIPEENKKSENIFYEINQPISIPIPNVNSIADKKNLIIEPSLPKDIFELNYHNSVINGISSKPLPKTHYTVKNKETNKIIYEFDIEIKPPFKFSYGKDKYGFKIGELINIKPTITVDDNDNDKFKYVVSCNRKLPNGLELDKYSGSICGIASDYIWEDDYDIKVQSNIGVKSMKLTLFVGEKPKSFKYKNSLLRCFVGDNVEFTSIFEGRCCEFRVVEGELPDGFILNRWNGLLSGITYCTGEYKLKVRCENVLGCIDEEVTIEVSDKQSSVIQYEKNLYELILGERIDPIIPKMNNEGDYSFIVYTNNLPSGLTLDNKTGIISGTPTEICKCEKVNKMKNKKGEEIEYGTKVGRNVLIAYKERNSHYTSVSLYFHIGKAPQLFKYGEKNEFIIFRSRYFLINPTYDDCECKFYIINGSLPSDLMINGLNGSIYGRTYDSIKTYEIIVRCSNSFGSIDVKLKLDVHEYMVKEFKYDERCNYLTQNEAIKEIKPLAIPCDGKCDVEKTKLPAGLSINEEGIINGSPTVVCDKCDNVIYWNGVRNSISTIVEISVGIKPNIVLNYQNNGKFKCGCGKEFHYSLLNDQNEILKFNGLFSIQPNLPIGIRLNQQTGEISGIVQNENGDNHYTVVFDNYFGRISTEIEIITGYPPNPISYSQPYYSFGLNSPISITSLKYGGNNLTFSINPPLPEGIRIRSDCGMISGKATSKPYYEKHKVSVSNDYGSCETELLLYFGNADYFVYYDDIEYYASKENDIIIKPQICGKKCDVVIIPTLPDGLKMTKNCEIVGKTKETMKLTKYTIIQRNEYEYTTYLLLEIGEKPKSIVYEKNEYEINVNERFSIKPKEKNIGCKYTVEPEFPDGVQIHPIKGAIYGKLISSLVKTNYTIICRNKYGCVKTNLSLTITEKYK